MAAPLPLALHAPITDLASGMAWIDALHAAGLDFGLDEDPASYSNADGPLFADDDLPLIRERCRQLYSLDWSPPGAGPCPEYCPIGYMMWLEPFDPHWQAPGCLEGIEVYFEGAGFVLLDCKHGPDWSYGEPGRFSLHMATGDDLDPVGDLLSEHDTPEAAFAACPELGAAFAASCADVRAMMEARR